MNDDNKAAWLAILEKAKAVVNFAWSSCGVVALAILLGHGVRGCSFPAPTPPAPINADISLPSEVQAQPGVPADISAITKGKLVRWAVPDGVYVRPGLTPLDAFLVAPVRGRYKVLAWTCTEAGPTDAAVCWLVVGDVPPPGPGPGPGPGPSPGPAPIPAPGLRVLMVYESKNLSKYPPGQLEAMFSTQVTQYLQEKCVKVGNQPEFRRYDVSTDLKNESRIWQDAFVRPRKSLPWVIISTGVAGTEEPLPITVDETMKLLKKFGGMER